VKVMGHDCGCESRKEILTSSGAGSTELIIIGVSVALLIVAWRVKL
jgi:hypothetical protein